MQNQEIHCGTYYKKFGIKDWWQISKNFKVDPTQSFVVKNDKKVCRYLASNWRPDNYSYVTIRYLWGGWRSRLERVQDIVDRAYKSAKSYEKDVLVPVMKAHAGEKLCWWFPDTHTPNLGSMRYIDVYSKKEQTEGEGCDFWRFTSGNSFGGLISKAAMCQFPNWDIGKMVHEMVQMSQDKWQRYYKVKRYLDQLIDEKLRLVEKDYKPDDIVEFKINDHKYRFVRVSNYDREAEGLWRKISTETPQNVNMNSILPSDRW